MTLQLSQQLDVLLEMLCDKLEADTVEQTEKVLQSLQQKLYDIGESSYESMVDLSRTSSKWCDIGALKCNVSATHNFLLVYLYCILAWNSLLQSLVCS